MADESKPRGRLILQGISASPAPQRLDTPLNAERMRSAEELTPLAVRIAENADLIQRFRAVVGCDDRERASKMMDEVREYAQTLDPSISYSEGARIVLVLLNILGPFERASDG